jgi:hypothetical protein
MLRENVAAHGLGERITVIERAVDSARSSVEIWTGFASGQAEVKPTAGEPTITRFGGDKGELHRVPASGLAKIIAESGIPSAGVALVWSDSQGSESEVIESGAELWSSGVPLFVEVDPLSLDAHGGLERFVRATRSHFDRFIPSRDRIAPTSVARPIAEFAQWLRGIPELSYEDVLLIPSRRVASESD